MRVRIEPTGTVRGVARVPGDKSIAHRWLILAATAEGSSRLGDLPPALDVGSTARCLAALAPEARDVLERWGSRAGATADDDGFTFNKGQPRASSTPLIVRGRGRDGLEVPPITLDCGNSGTTMRLLAGVVAACRFPTSLTGDESLRARPMERIAEPLRRMGAAVETTDGRPPISVRGAHLHGIRHSTSVPSAQVKGAVLLAGLAAEGTTTVVEPVATRDHTERALAHLGAPVRVTGDGEVSVEAHRHEGFSALVPGDVSSAAFLVAAAALTGGGLTLRRVGLNPSRIAFLAVMERMGVRTRTRPDDSELGEPVGELEVLPCEGLRGTTVGPSELPLVIDEVPVLTALAAHAEGETRFLGAAELRVKESDRLGGLARGVRALGGHATAEADDLIVAGGGLEGGRVDPQGDHRIAMSWCVAGLAARAAVEVEGMEAASVSFPGFIETLRTLGARIGG
ncbi:MAG TPA: 3-phosphoshikimate 1-carboxyvinyltransferase [Actinomycetota bacterium]|nr:3-phosphoshikimate 1-carboxyvinyltransferase [Actinomycetota bacterium]